MSTDAPRINPARFRLHAFLADTVMPAIHVAEATSEASERRLARTLAVELVSWALAGARSGYFPDTALIAHALGTRADAWTVGQNDLERYILTTPKTHEWNSVHSFRAAFTEARENLTPQRREFLRLVFFAEEQEWEERLGQAQAFAEEIRSRSDAALPREWIDLNSWCLVDSLRHPRKLLDADLFSAPSRWRNEALGAAPWWTETMERRDRAARDVQQRLAEVASQATMLDPAYEYGEFERDELPQKEHGGEGRVDPARGEPMSLRGFGDLLRERGDAEGAEDAYRRAEGQGDVGAAVMLAIVLSERGDVEGAEAAYRRADAHGDPQAAFNLGKLLEDRGDRPGAVESYERAIGSGDRDVAPKALVNIGNLFLEEGRTEEGARAFRLAAESGHGDVAPKALVNLGVLLLQIGDRAGAVAALLEAAQSGHPDAGPAAQSILDLWS